MKKIILLISLLFIKYASAQFNTAELSSMVDNSVVLVETYDQNDSLCGTGSGVVLSDDGIIITNYHVYDCKGNGKVVKVYHKGRYYYFDKELKKNSKRDYLVFSIKNCNLPAIQYGNSNKIKPGEYVYAVGCPKGFPYSFTMGITSGFISFDNLDYIQHSAAISPGSSGGALINSEGKLIGINVSSWDDAQNLNNAIPFTEIWKEIKDIEGIKPLTSESTIRSSDPHTSSSSGQNNKDQEINNKECEEKNVGDFCFTNNTSVKLSVMIFGDRSEKLTLEAGQTQCFYNKHSGSWRYSYGEENFIVKRGEYNNRMKGEGNILIEKCKKNYFNIGQGGKPNININSNSDCEIKNTGTICFKNSSSFKLYVHITDQGGLAAKQYDITLDQFEENCLENVLTKSYFFVAYKFNERGHYHPNENAYKKSQIFVEKCESKKIEIK